MKTVAEKPMTAQQVLDTYFLETRAKIIEVAANLDRVDRASGAEKIQADPRMAFIAEALKILESKGPGRAERVLKLYSKA